MSVGRGGIGYRASDELLGVFGRLELRVLDALWERGGNGASVRDLQIAFPAAAYTTLMTTLDRLHRKGVLDRQKTGRAFVYTPRYSREELRSGLAATAFGAMLGPDGDAGAARPILSCFVEAVSRHDRALLDELERLVREKQREHGRDGQ